MPSPTEPWMRSWLGWALAAAGGAAACAEELGEDGQWVALDWGEEGQAGGGVGESDPETKLEKL